MDSQKSLTTLEPEATLDQIDVDGAIRESAHAAADGLEEGDTRLDFLRKAGLAGGAVMGGGALLGALSPAGASAQSSGKGRPPAKFGKGDIGVLNYALTLEYLEAAFYNRVTARQKRRGFIRSRQARIFLRTVTADENAHVAFLKKALGNKAVARPRFDFGRGTANARSFLRYAYTFENTGVGAYSGQALNIQNPAYVAAALSILTVEARHASVAGLLLDRSPKGIRPDGPFDKPLTAGQVLGAVDKLGVIK